MTELDHTHDAVARSWVAGANDGRTDFPLQNLPLGIFHTSPSARGRIGIAIGDQVLDVAAALDRGLLGEARVHEDLLRSDSLNALMAAGPTPRRLLRHAAHALLEASSPRQREARACLVPMAQVRLALPARIGDFTDFFTSLPHARRTGELARPDMPVAPNFRHMPIAYHGRASSVVASGEPCRRPKGQIGDSRYRPTERLDFELEVGCYVGPGNLLGEPIGIDDAQAQVFGLSLVNDWSARDIQRWESQPLGPFLAKSFMTSVSPWVVTLEALAPFRAPAPRRGEGEPALSDALTSPRHEAAGAIDIQLEVLLQTGRMRREGMAPAVISRPRLVDQYWTLFQMLAHHTSNGCNLRPGDLLSSGTVSGPERENSGCLLELTAGGREPLRLPSGEERRFLEDGDTVILRGRCERDGHASIGFGECRALIVKETA
jgi:fumarylacetoacetase